MLCASEILEIFYFLHGSYMNDNFVINSFLLCAIFCVYIVLQYFLISGKYQNNKNKISSFQIGEGEKQRTILKLTNQQR